MNKIYTTLFLIFVYTTLSFSQVEVSSRLLKAVADAGPDDYIRTLVLLRDQVDLTTMDRQFYQESATIKRRAYEVITLLQDKARTTQVNLLTYLDEKSQSGDVFKYQSFWISNLVMVEAKPNIITELMSRLDLLQMDVDGLLELDRPVEASEGEVEGTESVEPGLRIINAHLLWDMGITGQGRLVMGHDTGVHPNHPALNHKWRGNHVPANQAWIDPGGGTTSPNDCDGHGSHTVGTMVGRSLTTADTIGVAIDAEWIAAKTICSSPHTSNSITAFQWALNPDGNPATIDDMPDVISCSWWDPNATNQCDPSNIYATTLTALEVAGIAVTFSAGNSGPGTSTITQPKNMNLNETLIFSVGAIDGAQYIGGNNNPIANFSSRGPSVCGGTGSLLIKPEVSAPGVSVRSSGTSTGYNNLSGTSMAAPHVAGAVALLKQVAPNLTGKQILEALYYTAVDLGTPGEDNNYGMGLIDVYAAFLSLGEPDSTAPDPITDLAVTSPTSNSITLTWTVPYDSSMNGVTGYDIRYSTSPIPDTNAFNNAAQLAFLGTPDTTGASESLLVDGLDFSTQYYFSIRARDMWSNWSDLSNQASGTTWMAPEISVDPISITHTLFPAMTVLDTINVANVTTSPSTLDFTVMLDNNTFPEGLVEAILVPKSANVEEGTSGSNKDNPDEIYGVSIDGMGGPDLFGYKWIDSDEPNGPVYEWNDIVSTGTEVTNWIATGTFDPRDEGYAGPFPLGFNFNFYGNPKTQVYVSSNGVILFNTLSSNIITNATIPSTAVPNEYIAPFWDDLDGRTQGTVHYKQDGNKFVIQFTNWQKYSGTGSLTFQVVLHSNGRIMFYYNNMNATLNSATVGIENATGTDGLQVAYNAAYVTNGLAVKFSADPEWLSNDVLGGTIYNGNSVDVVLTFQSEDYPYGEYTMDVIISSNDPLNSTVTVPVTMNLQAIPVELSALTALANRNNVVVNWTTAIETNNSGFEVERQLKGTSEWNKAGFVDGKGTTTEVSAYSFVDKGLQMGKYSYRLKQIDFDGTFEYSNVIEVDVSAPQEYTLYQNYPNPFNPATTIEYSLPEKSNVTISIYTALGELVKTLVNESVEAGYQKATFDASNLPSGTYIYQIRATSEGKTFVDSKKMMLIK